MAITIVALTDTFDGWRVKTNQLITQSNYYEANLPSYPYANNIGVTANAFASATIAGANTAVGDGANNFTKATLAGANTAVGDGANNFTKATLAGANTAVGNGANNFFKATLAGANAEARIATNLTSGTVPSARLSGSYTGITGVGTITAGIWNGTDIALADGGTNASLTASAGAVAYSTASAIAFTGVGTSGQVLTSSGTSAPTWATIFPSTTAMLFAQATAPTGWTKSTTHNDKALRVVSGTSGGSSGGTVVFSTAFSSKAVSGSISSTTATGTISSVTATGTVGSTVLDATQIPSHQHLIAGPGGGSTGALNNTNYIDYSYQPASSVYSYTLSGNANAADRGLTSATGGGLGHTHTFTGNAHAHTFTGDAHSHTFTGTAIDMAVQYVDIIIATKD